MDKKKIEGSVDFTDDAEVQQPVEMLLDVFLSVADSGHSGSPSLYQIHIQ